ncbi:Uncharacterised protein [Salmonella enterica subsp. enterica serovar Bovismorbificans]|uniref:Uncharacterized protein n=1 Tax=Salmonella enterica subsp. enterica serovar Bovismorbificans TaxID=58097 RepID=A0A655ELH6_SALET|nr:Uncharacterised protein [Salmonella enterica subsp. enterica serovar Bovismorbificans]
MQYSLQDIVRLIDLFPGHRLYAEAITATGFLAFFLRQDLIIGYISFRFRQRFLIAWLIDGKQDLILFHQLVIMHVYMGNQARDIRGNSDDIGAKTRVSRPGRFGVIHPGAENGDKGQNNQYEGNGRTGEFSC